MTEFRNEEGIDRAARHGLNVKTVLAVIAAGFVAACWTVLP